MMSEDVVSFNGWKMFAHPCFLQQIEELSADVESLKHRFPETFGQKKATKRLAAIFRLITEEIPSDPGSPVYRQGKSLGDGHAHWFRAKFFQQYRLFFRFRQDAKIIVIGWVNDDSTKRAYDSPTDAYRVFRRMIDAGTPPDDWDSLLRESAQVGGAGFLPLI